MRIYNQRYGERGTVSSVVLFVLLIFILILCGCDDNYNRGFKNGVKEGQASGFAQGKKIGYEDGHKSGYDKGYAEAMAALSPDAPKVPVRSIDGAVFSSRGSTVVFWLFAVLNFAALLGAALFLIARNNDALVIAAKVLVAVLASYIWFRIFEPWILGAGVASVRIGYTPSALIEVAAVFLGILICLVFDQLYIKRQKADVWVEAIGVAFCSLVTLSLVILVLNRHALLAESDLRVVFHGTTALAMGGLSYIAWALLARFTARQSAG